MRKRSLDVASKWRSAARLADPVQGVRPFVADSAPMCTQRPHLFEAKAQTESRDAFAHRARMAVALCLRCESLDSCRAWYDRLPPHTVTGVVAGRVRH